MLPNYLSTFPHFVTLFGMGILLLGVFWSLHTFLTPHDELTLIRQGNVSAAVLLVCVLLGFALPVASALSHSVSLMSLAQWGVVAMVIQLLTFAVSRLLFSSLVEDISKDRISVALFAGGLALTVGILNAAAMAL